MSVRQFSLFVENKAGRIAQIAGVLAAKQINIFGFCLADTGDYGIVRLVVSKPDEAAEILRGEGFTVKENRVLCVRLPNSPGALAMLAAVVTGVGCNIDYLYWGARESVIFMSDDVEGLEQTLTDKGLSCLADSDID
ncbi:MAG: acetolactate synthase 3 regulatory subunit [Actinobacteria bacterium ADurb.Bin444]|nr:MAG: acetolactate synthase 3 regulatory subunit [Actinobacteria bacterium ADurb.Bin444]